MASSATIALLSNTVDAKETSARQTITESQLKHLDDINVTSNQDIEKLLQDNAQKLIQNKTKAKDESYVRSAFDQYHVVKKEADQSGSTHYTLEPNKDNVTASDSRIKVHVNNDNKVTLINGNLDKPKIETTNKVQLSKNDAEDKALSALGIDKNKISNIKGYPVISNNKLDINSDKKNLFTMLRLTTYTLNLHIGKSKLMQIQVT